jgi:hypothetical protein
MFAPHISKEKTKQLTGSLLALTIMFSMALLVPLASSDTSVGNNVSWQSQDETTQNNWDWTNQGWQFGPYPTFSIILQNGTELTNDNYIPLGQTFTVKIDIQKSIFVGNATLGQAGLNWGIDIRAQNGSITGNANCNMNYINSIQTGNYNQTNTWNIFSNINNQTATAVDVKGPSGPQPMPQQTGFYQFNTQLSNITETELGWRLQIVGAFNNSTPLGPYWVNLQITDQYNNWMDVSGQGQQNSLSNNRQVAVGQAGFVYGGYQDYYNFEKLDMQNNPLMSVSKGAEWKMRLDITSAQFSNITIGLNLPWNIQQFVNVTGWYQQVVTEHGGWMYDENGGSYYWNSTVEVTRTQQVYGPHLEQRWISLSNTQHQVNITNMMWNPVTNQNELSSQQINIQDQLFLTFNQATQTFDIKIGYSYNSLDPNMQQMVQYQELSPINTSDPSSQFYNLVLSDCNYHKTGPNSHVVEFAGLFTNTTNYVQDQYSLQVNVFSATQQIWANWENTNPSDMQVIIDRPVAVSTILDAQGNPATTQSMFMIGQNKPFIVQSKVYGSSKIYQDLDAVGVSFYSNFGTWSETENSNSQVEIRLTKNLDTGVLTSTSYNRTNINRYVYDSHIGWAYVNVTDWHTEYNSATGMWDWVESPHLIWNQTTLTDWHWEYYRLNQTEYARDPNSPNIWMDTTTTWVDDMDPAFITSTSYARLDSANVTVTNGVVVANLGVVFNTEAPQGNYWYNMIFQNMTYGQDPSQGWGQHQITEWTNEPTYFINGLATDGQSWLVEAPSNPLYTTFQAQKYRVNQEPYITIENQDILIKPQVQYDQAQQQDWIQYLLTGPYDPSIGRQTQYYQLPNGTNIYINQAYQTIIRILQLTTTNAYTLVDGLQVLLPNGTTVSTYMNLAQPDYAHQHWDPSQGNVVPYYYDLLNGSRIYFDGLFEQSLFNSTTNHWDKNNQVYNESDSTLLVESAGSGVKLDGTVVLVKDPGYWQSLPDGTGYYLVMQNGTRLIVQDPFSVPDDQRIVTLNGVTYHIGWPNQYYKATYQGQTLLIPNNGPNGDNYVQSYFYTNLGIEGGLKYELPYPGAMATSWWDLQGIESTSQKLKTLKTITDDGSDYLLNFDSNSQMYYIDIDKSRQTVTYPTVDNNNFYSTINGQDYWNITQNGWIINYGTYSQQAYQLTQIGTLSTTTGYDQNQQTWTANRYGYDYENATLYLMMPNGTRLDVSSTMNLIVWKVQVNDQIYYTSDNSPSTESIQDSSGQTVFRNYFKTLNGQKVYFDWDTPASWQQEIHIPISGTNYTRLIPYTWETQTIFDKVIIYNITIPAVPGNATSTGVYFENGTEVAVGTPFKVIGSNYGPGTDYTFNQNGNNYNFDGAYMPTTQAPWNHNINVGYCITLDGSRIYSPTMFGWNGDINNNPWNTDKQWQFNGDEAFANSTVPVAQGGYAIYLNSTLRVEVTSMSFFGSGASSYVVLMNGTHLDVQWVSSLNQWFTVVGTEKYVFNNIVAYSKLDDGGFTYSVCDPLEYDQRHIYTATTYQAPSVSTNAGTWLWMNATTASILRDDDGYYLVNASNHNRIDIQLVDDWWGNIPSQIRNQVFTNQLSDYYPRFNITINGIEYFVMDPSPVTDRWSGEWSSQNAMYRYPNTLSITLDGLTYDINLYQNVYSWNNNITIAQLNTINIGSTSYDLDDQYNWKPSYQVTINNESLQIQMENMNIYKTHQSCGNIYTWKLTDLGIQTTSQVNNLIVGTPQFGMWGIKAYKTVDNTGAVDLDGNTANASDQYFVRKIHSGTDAQTQTTKRMVVETNWNPDATKVGDDIHLNAWMGQLQVTWTSQWSESYIWYHASDMSPVSSQEMAQISDIIVNSETQQPNPGYWDLAYMVRNQTWNDVLAQAKANNWDWINSNTNEWNWLWFGTDQNYNVNVLQDGKQSMAGVDLKYEFAGINVLNGTTQTHYFMPKTVGEVTFVTPGQAYGNNDASGNITLPLDSKIDFGVTYGDVNGTLFPYSGQRSMWGWWDQPIFGSDFNVPNLMSKPTTSSIDELAFTVHFSGSQTESQYNTASMKIDQRVGDWNLPADVIDGREQNSSGVMVPLMGNEILQNRSLALNYYVSASTSMGWSVKDDNGANVNNNDITNSSQFNVASALSDVTFASVKLGSTYDWGKPTTATDQIRTFNVTSQTTSIQNFQSSYQSGAGKSSTGFDISSSMYFLTQCFPRWDGYSIYNDPEVSVMVSKGATPENNQPTPPPTEGGTPQPTANPTNQPTNQQTTSPTSSPTNNPNAPTPPPQGTTPTPKTQTPHATESPPKETPTLPTVLILAGVAIGLGAAVGSIMLVRAKKKRN